jgi:hypothetical protein
MTMGRLVMLDLELKGTDLCHQLSFLLCNSLIMLAPFVLDLNGRHHAAEIERGTRQRWQSDQMKDEQEALVPVVEQCAAGWRPRWGWNTIRTMNIVPPHSSLAFDVPRGRGYGQRWFLRYGAGRDALIVINQPGDIAQRQGADWIETLPVGLHGPMVEVVFEPLLMG